MENQTQGREEDLAKLVALGEVVSDIYRGEEISAVGLGFVARPGGAPANVAVAACRLGSEAAFVGSVGEDLFGDFILRALESEGVDTSNVGRQSPPTRTSLAFVEIDTDGDREFTFYRSSPAADELLSPEDVTEDVLSGASFVNFGSIPLIREPARSATRRIAEPRLHGAGGGPVAPATSRHRGHRRSRPEVARPRRLPGPHKQGTRRSLLRHHGVQRRGPHLRRRRHRGRHRGRRRVSGRLPRTPLGPTVRGEAGARSLPQGLRRRRPRLHRLRRHARPPHKRRTRKVHGGQPALVEAGPTRPSRRARHPASRHPKPHAGAVREPSYRRTRLTSTGTSTNPPILRAKEASEGSSVAAWPASITVRPSDSARRASW